MHRLGLALAVLLTVCGVRVRAADLPEIQARRTLRVLAVDGAPRFVNLHDGEPGFDREMLERFAALRQLTVEVVPSPSFDRIFDELLAGRGDVVAGAVTVTEARRQRVDFTAEVFPTRHVVVNLKPMPPVTTLEQLRTLSVGTQRGTSLTDEIQRAGVPPANVYDTVKAGELTGGLRAGKFQACVLGVEDAVMLQRDDPRVQLGMFLGSPGSLAFAVRKDAPQLRRELDGFIGNTRRSGSWNRLVVKYFGAAVIDVLNRAQRE
jgi:ABC-type amino acid transport substrate-binding protein